MYKKIILILILIFPLSQSFAASISDYIHESAKSISDIQFINENNTTNSLNDYKGKVVLVNFWATWCKPCVDEMPALSRLQESISGLNIKILPVSVDYKGIDVVNKFYKDNNIKNLESFLDTKGSSFKSLNLKALPTTIILNKEGDEVVRVLGDFDWDNKEVKKYLVKLSGE